MRICLIVIVMFCVVNILGAARWLLAAVFGI